MLSHNSKEFIHPQYVPPKFIWKDPRNLTKDAIIHLCNHIRKRQDELGPTEGMRFRAYFDGKNMVPADYGIREDDRRAAAKAKKQQTARMEKRPSPSQNGNEPPRRPSPSQKGKEAPTRPSPSQKGVETPNRPSPSQKGKEIPRPRPLNPRTPNNIPNTVNSQYSPQIDPALIVRENSTAVIDTGNQNSSPVSGGYIDEPEMQLLIANGFLSTIP